MAPTSDKPASPWKPSTRATARVQPSSTSSPAPSTPRPQRASREISTMGAKFQARPTAVASSAAARAVRFARFASKAAASASGTGKMVRNPWITSAANSSGMPRRDSSTATVCMRRCQSAESPLNTAPSRPSRTAWACSSIDPGTAAGLAALAGAGASAAGMMVSCPAFSSSVIAAIKASIRSATVVAPPPPSGRRPSPDRRASDGLGAGEDISRGSRV